MQRPQPALLTSAAMTLSAQWSFGYLKGHDSGTGALRSVLQTLSVGGLAASAAFLVARLVA
ncbi:VIT1/CCC1 family predicted Fe2+/Mn2+ transporter [Oxalobacteraceae bacterium GrIS 1.11]